MDEAQHLADRVAVIAAGRIVAEGTPATLAGRDTARATVRYRVPDAVSPPTDLVGRRDTDGYVEFAPDDLTRALHRLTGWAIEHAVDLHELRIVRPSLEDVYLQLTGEPAATTVQAPARTESGETG
jgi:ABC-2 type transport system ATP-binding protein